LKSKRILFINNGFAGGGIERASVSLANHYAISGHHVSIIALYQSEHFFKIHESINIIEPTFRRTRFNKYIYVFKMTSFLRRESLKLKPDTILSFSEWTNPFVVLGLIGTRFPLYLSDRMNPLAKLPFLTELLKKKLYKRANGIIAQTNYAKEIIEKKTKAKNIVVIPNPVNIIQRVDCTQKKRIVTVGRLTAEKGHRYLIKSFSLLKNKDWELSIVGDGKERLFLEKFSKQLKIHDKVIFHGHLKDFSYQLSEAQIFVLPSLKEGFPNALIESMAMPLACICTDFLGAKNEVIQNELNGLIVKTADEFEMAKAIDRLIVDEALRIKLSKNAIKVRDNLAFDKIANKYLDIILE
jgi:GalNAc-alpha-(1->4)-GalNAc-alpha-(1->3)-diNAcBac-PP-undecaprenol alpha-1,4-N-acetyl-D-galactosaminyltransferase